MENPRNNSEAAATRTTSIGRHGEGSQQRAPSPAPEQTPRRRSRTRRDPSEDLVYRVHPDDFARVVQRLTGAPRSEAAEASAPPSAALSFPSSAPPSEGSGGAGAGAAGSAGQEGDDASRARRMQEAYLAWCTSNDVVLSPGTMAAMERGGEAFPPASGGI